ncbi:hypothetical protein GCM10025867_51140 (plasmid) [Frondihabitans sucicola]|uniref:Uncharacterized protein n=1 Tax=Frondihabitans sucicola TaxID=1268041 RepID=A0ABN6Y8L8_9MICO|nr:hypothetical protein [Frondihabitans sucicola]BDZ52306.1 hypothetical protein GCM10025867_45470 [Frondihabitans sucicola]BDZ52873.1 hypothetical protein GCM10025867_51140 [Frondihabitans sucicola]
MHTPANTDLGHALAIYFGRGISAYPAARFDHFDGGIDAGLRAAILRAVEDANAIPVEWGDGTEDSLLHGSRHMRARLAELRPDISEEGLDALEWRFSYEWR